MELEQRVASAIRCQTDTLDPFVPDLDSIRRAGRAQARRRAAMAVGGVAVAAALAVVAGSTLSSVDRGVGPVEEPDPDLPEIVQVSGVARIPDDRAEPVVVTPGIRAAVPSESELVREVSSADPRYAGSGQLVVGLDPTVESQIDVTCSDASELRYVMLVEPGATYYSAGRCDDATDSVTVGKFDATSDTQVRMFITDEDTGPFRRCFNYSPPQGCDAVEPEIATGSTAVMRITVRKQWVGPVAVTMFGEKFESAAIASGSAYSLIEAAAGANGAPELSFRIEASEADRIAQAVVVLTRQGRRCGEEVGPEAYWEQCYSGYQLLIDEEPVTDPFDGPLTVIDARRGHAGWGPLTPGEDHLVTLRVEGDPRNVNLGVLIYEVTP